MNRNAVIHFGPTYENMYEVTKQNTPVCENNYTLVKNVFLVHLTDYHGKFAEFDLD